MKGICSMVQAGIFLKRLRHLSENMTQSEMILWKELRNRKEIKAKFRRQHPIDIFIVDFYCHEFELAIEIDGEIHLNPEI